MFWTYLFFSDFGEFYIGQTENLARRVATHRNLRTCRFTGRNGNKWEVIDARTFDTREEAVAYESFAKVPGHTWDWVWKNRARVMHFVEHEGFRLPKELS